MKKQYEAPVAEKIEFCYRDQVVASFTMCSSKYNNTEGDPNCVKVEEYAFQ